MRIFFLLVLSLLAFREPGFAQEVTGDTQPCRIEAITGRVQVFHADLGQVELVPRTHRSIAGSAHLEVPAGATCNLSWTGRTTVRVEGPASLEWQPSSASARSEFPRRPPTNLTWNVFEAASLSIEVSNGTHRLHLPGDWHVDLSRCWLEVRGLPQGTFELYPTAGQTPKLVWTGDATQARPPVPARVGRGLLIDAPPPARIRPEFGAASWENTEWPWRVERDSPADREAREQLSQQTTRFRSFPTRDRLSAGPTQSVSGFPDPTEVRAERIDLAPSQTETGRHEIHLPPPAPEVPRTWFSPLTGKTARQAYPYGAPPVRRTGIRSTPSLSPSLETSAQPVPMPVPMATPTPIAVPMPTNGSTQRIAPPRDPWRGVAQSDYLKSGELWIQDAEQVTVTELRNGRVRVQVEAWTSPAWCLAPGRDFHLQPGTVAVFDAEGVMEVSYGKFESHAAPGSRESSAGESGTK